MLHNTEDMQLPLISESSERKAQNEKEQKIPHNPGLRLSDSNVNRKWQVRAEV